VEGVGRFGTPTRIDGLGSGVNILAAGNEAGKSTLFKAVRACLFERHNTKNESVRNLATDGLSLPVTVRLGFEHGDDAYTITKSFLKSPTASLKRGTTEIARGREADEMVLGLLGVESARGSVDEAAFGILWVEQGQSLSLPKLSGAATTALNAAIQAEVGTMVIGERTHAVLSFLHEELTRFVTDTGRPKAGGPLAEASGRLKTVEEDLTQAELRLSALDAQFVDLATKQDERGRLCDPAVVGKMTADFEVVRQNLKSGESAVNLLSHFGAAEQKANADLDREEVRFKDLAERATRIDGNRERVTELSASLSPLDDRERAARGAIESAREQVAAFHRQAERDDEEERSLQRVAKAVARAAARDELTRQKAGLVDVSARLSRNEVALSANRVTAETIALLDAMEREIAVLTAQLEAVAPRVSIELGPAGVGHVWLGEKVLDRGTVRTAVDPITIRVGELATITVSPQTSAAGADPKTRQQLQTELSALLAAVGVTNAGELRAARANRQVLEAESTGVQAQLTALGVGETPVAAEIERITAEIEDINASVASVLTEAKLGSLPTSEDITAQQHTLRQGREEARRKRQELDGSLEGENTTLAEIADTRGRLRGSLDTIQAHLDSDLAILSDVDRERLMAEAQASLRTARDEHRTKAAALEAQRRIAPAPEELGRLRNKVAELEATVESHRSGLGALDREMAHLEGQIQSAGGDGIGETVETLRALREIEHREVERHRARVATLQLVKDTIEMCYQEQRERLDAPLRRHLQPFLRDLFPSAELQLGDGFDISGLKRNGPAAEAFERLSAGTQEQLAVLVRLAMGALLCERGQEVPVILDDALVFSDDARIEQMFDALNRAGQKQQVIVLTCRTRTFEALSGQRLSIASGTP